MPPRYAYWTIIAGGLPTAFRAADREELLPTFQRIKEKHPDAEMKWFARGKLWESQEAARAADRRLGDRDGRRGRPSSSAEARRAKAEGRPREWRPGGEHRDPRQKFVDAKKQRNAAIRKDRWQRKNAGDSDQGDRQSGKRPWIRSQATEEPEEPPRPRGPDREPPPDERPEPTSPPRPDVPITPAPGPPERGDHHRGPRPFKPRGKFRKGPRRS
jgi:hypothetical protein